MAAPGGYNPNASLLPQGNGPIIAMSGGGGSSYDPTVSLLPESGGNISAYRGGGESFNSVRPLRMASYGGDVINTLSPRQLPNNVSVANTVNMTPPPGTPAVKLPIVKPAATPAANAAVPTAANATAPTAATAAVDSTPSPAIIVTKKEESVKKEIPSPDTLSDDDFKDITLFGTVIRLDNPSKIKENALLDSHIEALRAFGLDGPELSFLEKKRIIQSLFDEGCDTDSPLSMTKGCRPIREIIQKLSLKLLSKLSAQEESLYKVDSTILPSTKIAKEGNGITIEIKIPIDKISLLTSLNKDGELFGAIKDTTNAAVGTDQGDELTKTPEASKKNNNSKVKPERTLEDFEENSASIVSNIPEEAFVEPYSIKEAASPVTGSISKPSEVVKVNTSAKPVIEESTSPIRDIPTPLPGLSPKITDALNATPSKVSANVGKLAKETIPEQFTVNSSNAFSNASSNASSNMSSNASSNLFSNASSNLFSNESSASSNVSSNASSNLSSTITPFTNMSNEEEDESINNTLTTASENVMDKNILSERAPSPIMTNNQKNSLSKLGKPKKVLNNKGSITSEEQWAAKKDIIKPTRKIFEPTKAPTAIKGGRKTRKSKKSIRQKLKGMTLKKRSTRK